MLALNDRQNDIVTLARSVGRVNVEDLASRFEVSPQTIRKDLNDLCDKRILTRVHGGAVIASSIENVSYDARRFIAPEEKRAIGIAAAALIPNKSSLFINIGTTTEEVAAALHAHDDLLVITNNLNVATGLYRHPRIDVIVVGGPVRSDGAVIGSVAVDLIHKFKVDTAVIGASAIDEDGSLLDYDYEEVKVAQAIIKNARRVILVADRLKFERAAPIRIANLSEVDAFVTDRLPSEEMRSLCAASGVSVVETSPGSPDESDAENRAGEVENADQATPPIDARTVRPI
jgi:DeoR family glycerol-3-phosphate regulon repressor